MTSNNLAEGRFDKQDFVYIPEADEYRCPAGQIAIHRFTTLEHGLTLHEHGSSACPKCPIKSRCTRGKHRRIARWEHESVLEAMQERLDRKPESMRLRRRTVEHPFGTLKFWMGATHFLCRTLPRVSTAQKPLGANDTGVIRRAELITPFYTASAIAGIEHQASFNFALRQPKPGFAPRKAT